MELTEPGREELTLEQWRRRGFPEPTAQDMKDARLLLGHRDGPRTHSGVNPRMRPRLVVPGRNIVRRSSVPGGRIPRRGRRSGTGGGDFAAAFRRVANARAAVDNPDTLSEVSGGGQDDGEDTGAGQNGSG